MADGVFGFEINLGHGVLEGRALADGSGGFALVYGRNRYSPLADFAKL